MRSTLKQIRCHQCHHSWNYESPLGRSDSCPNCGSDCKVCLNCQFFDIHSHNECKENQAEWVRDKDKGNFCNYFVAHEKNSEKESKDLHKTKNDLEKLFNNNSNSENTDQEKNHINSLEKLFKK